MSQACAMILLHAAIRRDRRLARLGRVYGFLIGSEAPETELESGSINKYHAGRMTYCTSTTNFDACKSDAKRSRVNSERKKARRCALGRRKSGVIFAPSH
jgi:hypothetical protein